METTIMSLFILQKPTEPPLGSHFFFPKLFRAITKPLAFSDPHPVLNFSHELPPKPASFIGAQEEPEKDTHRRKNHTPPETESEPCWNSKTTSEPAGGPDAPEIEETSRNCGSSFRYIFSFFLYCSILRRYCFQPAN
ncbi:hypothetical protein HanXRQr2_Chr17g0813531 [Helianthus annuus]|uniref:Uncharacterized protein n=1 Tax=Helianthus annuus TaxID=4232 RepID=A0A9K3DJ29_HELAN|nr:hypothetical protein HanXRQr2_Chr17g0813531 [Helianthus annuus]KAJ0429860.1 hypothetical protein HanHA300_Chr17g0662281 [Helianthus annuus]